MNRMPVGIYFRKNFPDKNDQGGDDHNLNEESENRRFTEIKKGTGDECGYDHDADID